MNQGELTYIKIPYPKASDLHFKITAPVCSLVIAPGIGNAWATDKYSDPKEVAPLILKRSGNAAQVISVGAFAYRTLPKQLPYLHLSFGRVKPFSLSIAAGNINDTFDFGGLPLTSLEIQYGSGDQVIDFSYPNQRTMERMKVTAETGLVVIERLVNANIAEIRLNGDATCYQVNFGGGIRQDTVLHIGIGVTLAAMSVPAGTAIKITTAHPPNSSTDVFTYAEKAYWNRSASNHQEPLLYIVAPNTSLNMHFS